MTYAFFSPDFKITFADVRMRDHQVNRWGEGRPLGVINFLWTKITDTDMPINKEAVTGDAHWVLICSD